MVHFINDKCVKCKYTDCVEVCPVDCFREGDEMLVIDPELCIDCGVCIPECPIEAIVNDDTYVDGKAISDILSIDNEQDLTPEQIKTKSLYNLNATLSQTWPSITQKQAPLPNAENFKDKVNKIHYIEKYYKVEE